MNNFKILNKRKMNEKELYVFFEEKFKSYSLSTIAENLMIAEGTIHRWKINKKIPRQYYFDLMRILKIPIDYKKLSFKDKDQFFTTEDIAKYCYNVSLSIIKQYEKNENNYIYIEPSAGNGNFLKILPQDRRIGLDVEPRNSEIIEQDFLLWKPKESKKYIVIGNPPFGLRGHLALKFINHSYSFADYVCFILPQLFESDGKGVPRKRVNGFHLIHSEKLESSIFEYPNNEKIKVQSIFQIWSKNHINKKYILQENKSDTLEIFSVSDGGTPSTTRNKKMHNKCHIFIPSTIFGKENMKPYHSFEELPGKRGYGIFFHKDVKNNLKKFNKIKWENIAFLSTNSAYNLRSSHILSLFT